MLKCKYGNFAGLSAKSSASFGLVSVIRRQIVSNPFSRSGQEVLTTVGKPQIKQHVC